jgi:DNA-binding NtrC family response regulator
MAEKESYSIKLLLVDDEENIRISLSTFLRHRGYTVATAENGNSAIDHLRSNSYDLMLTDLKMPGIDGIELTMMAKKVRPEIEVVLMTAFGSIRSAVEALKAGASNYLTKPLDHDELLLVISSVSEKIKMRKEISRLRTQLEQSTGIKKIIGDSPEMKEVLRQIQLAAPVDSTVLITGETGTGKELVAQAIHDTSPRRKGPLVELNCASLPESLVESELFGHKRGSFTGAIRDYPGNFMAADNGTILLDEIDSMSMASQAKLLRVLENKKITPIGGTESREIDVRMIAMSNGDLLEKARNGIFREDLYYRLCVVNIHIPPLRERSGDVSLLAAAFLDRIAVRRGTTPLRISPALMDVLQNYPWKGNVRELENAIESMAVLKGVGSYSQTLDLVDLPESFRKRAGFVMPILQQDDGATTFQQKVEFYEKFLLSEKMKESGGKINQVSQELEIPLRTLRRKLSKYVLNWRDFRPDRPKDKNE